jgi:hypothetical protein
MERSAKDEDERSAEELRLGARAEFRDAFKRIQSLFADSSASEDSTISFRGMRDQRTDHDANLR